MPEATPDRQLLITVPEAANMLRVSRTTFYELINSQQFPVVRIGRSVRVRFRDLEAWVADRVGV